MPSLTPISADDRDALAAVWQALNAALHAHGLGHVAPVLLLSGTDTRGAAFLYTLADVPAATTADLLARAASDPHARASSTVNLN